MPFNKFAMLIVSVIAAAGLTVWIGTRAAETLDISTIGGVAVMPTLLVALLVGRYIVGRNKDP